MQLGEVPTYCDGCKYWEDKKGCVAQCAKKGIEDCFDPKNYVRKTEFVYEVDR